VRFALLYEIEKLQPWGDGIDQLIFLVQHGGTPHEAIMDSLRRFGDEVIPQFSEARAKA
jgi:hypothetical protein